ncbi:hypothetical protein [Reinekea thalattae]|uniref:hypothetical protein n=1 Tax=Reinekea thalattae TaxID=2593301 RepID=UPI001C9BE5AA|nr:hypothetical protein [Reinekea thalattae]
MLEIYGYFGSALIATSLMMSNIIRLRWINLCGALVFASYGIFINAWPVALLNSFIVLIDLYHLHYLYIRTPKQTRTTQLPATSPYVVDILAIKWPALANITGDSKVQVTFKGSEPAAYEILS